MKQVYTVIAQPVLQSYTSRAQSGAKHFEEVATKELEGAVVKSGLDRAPASLHNQGASSPATFTSGSIHDWTGELAPSKDTQGTQCS